MPFARRTPGLCTRRSAPLASCILALTLWTAPDASARQEGPAPALGSEVRQAIELADSLSLAFEHATSAVAKSVVTVRSAVRVRSDRRADPFEGFGGSPFEGSPFEDFFGEDFFERFAPRGGEGFVRSGRGRREHRDHQGGPATGGRTWVVRRGDTFDGIARRLFGDASLAGEIARANPDVDPRRLRPGTTVRIPALRGRRVGGDGGVRPQGRVHRVRRGDRLQTIARRHYGSTSAWPRIYEANRDVLAHPDRLRPGMRLRIP